MKKILFMSHSNGDTDALIQVASSLLSRDDFKGEILFLPIGTASQDKLRGLGSEHILKFSPRSKILELKEVLNSSFETQVILKKLQEEKKLDTETLLKILEFINKEKITDSLIGTPSDPKCQGPFQIAKCLQESVNLSVYHDYLFHEPEHYLWTAIAQDDGVINYLFVNDNAIAKAKKENPSVHAHAVGHPMFNQVKKSVEDLGFRKELGIDENGTYIFVSGTSLSPEKDMQLLEALLDSLESPGMKDVHVRLGVHPGHPNLTEYFTQLEKTIENHPKIQERMKWILSPIIAGKVKEANISLNKKFYIEALGGDQASECADAVACAVPATLASKAALQGKCAFSFDVSRSSFLDPKKFYTGKLHLPLFLKEAQAKRKLSTEPPSPPSSSENVSFVEKMCLFLR